MNDTVQQRIVELLESWPVGYQTGRFEGDRYGVSLTRAINGRNIRLYAEELGGTNIVSFNLYYLNSDQTLLKPCEMSAEKITKFVFGFVPDKPL